MSVAGRGVALVTGAGQRVGQAIALHLAARGWRVAVHYSASEAGAAETVERIRSAGGHAAAFQADLRDTSSAPALIAAVVTAFGSLDALVNSAAGMERTPIGETTAERFDAIMALNLRAPFLLAQAAAAVMPHGSAIVNIADHMGEEPIDGYVVHGVSKAGVVALTRHLAAALAPRLRVNAVAPGFVLAPPGMPDSEIEKFVASTPLQRIGAPEDVAQAVAFLLDATYITGETLHVDGGRRVRH
jgi:pteridine reductase